jgi:hypothetical protein
MEPTRVQYYHHSQLWYLSCEARDRCVGVELPQLASDALVAIVISVASCEAFINALAASAQLDTRDPGYALPDWLPPFASKLSKMVENRASLLDKYLRAAEFLPGEPFDRGSPPVQDFAALVRLRDALVHMKAAPSDDVLQRVLDLTRKGQARRAEKYIDEKGRTRQTITSWVDQISTPDVARWACKSTWVMMRAILDKIPPTRAQEFSLFKDTFPQLS